MLRCVEVQTHVDWDRLESRRARECDLPHQKSCSDQVSARPGRTEIAVDPLKGTDAYAAV